MINMFEQQQDLESFSDQMLSQEVQQPSGRYPQYLVASELQRRADMRRRFSQQNQVQGPAPTVVEQRMSDLGQGIPQLSQGQMGTGNMPPQGPGNSPSPVGGGITELAQGKGYATGGLVDPEYPPEGFRRSLMRSAGIASNEGPGLLDWLARNLGTASMRREPQPPGATPPFNPDATQPFVPGDLDPERIAMMMAVRDSNPLSLRPGAGGGPPAAVDRTESQQAAVGGRQVASAGGGQDLVNVDPTMSAEIQRAVGGLRENRESAANAAAQIEKLGEGEQEILARMMKGLEGPNATETELARQRRSPEELAADRRRRALSGLGVAIGTAARPGDVARSLGNTFNDIENLRETQRRQENELALRLATSQDQREQQRIGAELQGLQARQGVVEAVQSVRTAAANADVAGTADLARATAALYETVGRNRMYAVQAASAGAGGGEDLMELLKFVNTARDQLTDSMEGVMVDDPVGGGKVPPPDGSDDRALFDGYYTSMKLMEDMMMSYLNPGGARNSSPAGYVGDSTGQAGR